MLSHPRRLSPSRRMHGARETAMRGHASSLGLMVLGVMAIAVSVQACSNGSGAAGDSGIASAGASGTRNRTGAHGSTSGTSGAAGSSPLDAGSPSVAGQGTADSAGVDVDDASTDGAPTQRPDDDAMAVGDAGPLTPKFQKTACIDPSAVTADTEHEFLCNSIEFWVVVPKQCFTRTCGLIFNIHGATMTDHVTMEQATNMIAIGSMNDFIVVHPHNPSGTWNLPDDIQTVFDAMQQIVQAFDVDPDHVHSTGYSQGARISWALACEHADVVASIAPAEENNTESNCWKTSMLPVRQVSVLFQFGKQDEIAGGFSTAQTTVNEFVAADMLAGPQTIGGATGSDWLRQRWTNSGGNVLEFISHNYTNPLIAGHCLVNPMGTTYVNCSTPVGYNWGEEAVAFFQAHPLH